MLFRHQEVKTCHKNAGSPALVIHVSDKQIHHLLTALEKNEWTWSVHSWVKQVSKHVVGNNLRVDQELWVVCWSKDSSLPFNIEEGMEEQR